MLEQSVAVAPDYQTGHYYLGLALARVNRNEESSQQLAIATRMADEDNKSSAQHLELNP